ncbi:MAG: Holliday junction branch migration protein RuvA [Candidatus Paceibacterota bacterium]
MIAQLTGTVAHIEEKYIILSVHDVGYRLFITLESLSQISVGETRTFWTHLVVREDVLDLYGFLSLKEKQFFELLISVSGVGPKTALSILSIAGIETLTQAIVHNDTSYLTKVSGIGKKNADKIVLELKDKFEHMKDSENIHTTEEIDALEALLALGFSRNEARDALKKVPASAESTSERVTLALKYLGK